MAIVLWAWVSCLAAILEAQDFMQPALLNDGNSNSVRLTWGNAGQDAVYTLQSTRRLSGYPWLMTPQDRPDPLSGTTIELPLQPAAPAQFYRLITAPHTERGKVLSASSASSFSVMQLGFIFQLGGIPATPEHGVRSIKLTYETLDPWGAPTTASGLLVLPDDITAPLPLVSYQHGTALATNDVPTASLEQSVPGLGFASLGYAVVLPDLLGLGNSPGFHPYHHARSEATAAVDLLRAARTWSATNGVVFSGQLFLCGYSQGGHATMALHRELQYFHADEFSVTASAPMAGAYDLSGTTLNDFLSGRPLPNRYYVVYLVRSYQEVYGLSTNWSDWLRSPYDATVPPLLNGRVAGSVLNDALTNDVRQLFNPEVLHDLEDDPDHPLRIALRDNDLFDWKPEAPVLLVHCQGDLDVPYQNSVVARDTMTSLGASQVSWVDPQSGASHSECAVPAFLTVKDWFDSLRTDP